MGYAIATVDVDIDMNHHSSPMTHGGGYPKVDNSTSQESLEILSRQVLHETHGTFLVALQTCSVCVQVVPRATAKQE
jgi:hypothetical protein